MTVQGGVWGGGGWGAGTSGACAGEGSPAVTDERADVQSAPPRARLIRLGRVLWAGVAGLVSLSYAQAAVEGATDQLARVGFVSVTGVFAAVRVVLIIAAIGAVVWIGMELVPVVVAARRGRESEEVPTPQKG